MGRYSMGGIDPAGDKFRNQSESIARFMLAVPNICAVYRLNTYPLIHINFLHAILNIFALVPLLERFEADHGTLLTGAMFIGRMSLRIGSSTEGRR